MATRPSAGARLTVEQLEDRQLLAARILFNPATGAVTMDGTALSDRAEVRISGDTLSVTLTHGAAPIARTYDLRRARSIVFHGYEGNDRLTTTAALPVLAFGGAGSDLLRGGSRNDKLYGGTGNDTVQAGAGNDYLYGLDGNDALYGDAGNDRLYGGAGNNSLTDPAGRNSLNRTSNGSLTAWVLVSEEHVLATSLPVYEREIIGYTNQERERHRLPLLRLNLQLLRAAQHHARNMARFEEMAHELAQADLPTMVDRALYYGYAYRWLGENVAYGYPDARSVVAAWMDSPGHRANILGSDFTEIGVGLRVGGDGLTYYCQLFGQPM
jgi:uncharacterized protein YkwD